MATPTAGLGVSRELTTLIKRLEAATSRLEDMAISSSSAQLIHVPSDQGLNGTVPPSPAPLQAQSDSPSVAGFSDIINGPLERYLGLSKELGGLIEQQAGLVSNLFHAQRDYLAAASVCAKPASGDMIVSELLKPTTQALLAVTEVREPGRERKFQNHLSVISEGIPAFGWVTVEPKPGPYVKDMKESAEFYANRVVKEFKESDPRHADWARSFVAVLEDLRKYVVQHHTTGVVWNSHGGDLAHYLANRSPSAPSSAPAAPAPPPPPPAAPSAPPPPQQQQQQSTPKAAAPGDMSNVFADLNKGGSVTSGLKKVDPSQMTHKNPSLRGSAPVAASSSLSSSNGPPAKPPKPHSFQKKPPKTELDGTKWLIENHENNSNIVIDQVELGHTVNVFNCKSSVIQVVGKVNAVSLVNCTKVSVLVSSLVSALSITSSPSFTVQVTGKVPTVTIDGTDGGQLYLSKETLDIEIVTAKSSSINISLPVEGEEDGIFAEKPVPEQLKTVIREGKLVTTVVEHSG